MPQADELRMVDGDLERDGWCEALYRDGDRLVGALTINSQSVVMKYRRQIVQGTSWRDAL
ncbi:hypothetical protein [Amycolatopsis lurida]|uniref:hypothetical protein n=1 Tax=Amycolatopsis lurida TaxID=31959 RepID=UPI000A48EABF